jgi:AraC family transcriptional regulator, regulatory protein of adaptative response / methylated-DNA-[protein]-cysteine methyltransferase
LSDKFNRKIRIESGIVLRDNSRMITDSKNLWKAVVERDSDLDGQFVYAVKTTKIYCRPTCPSKRPNRQNVEFFQTIAQAKESGYRACSRCRPDAATSNAKELVMKVQNYIKENLDQSLTLERIGKAIGVSPFHLQRVFKSATGMSPRQYTDECRLSAVKSELKSGQDVTHALYEAGYSSSSRLYERSSRELGMTPGSYAKQGAGELINYALVHSPLGLLLLAGTKKGLCFLQFGDSENALVNALSEEFSAATMVQNAEPLSAWLESLSAYFAGRSKDLSVPVDLRGTIFQQSVWRYLREIPPGETRTYSQVAQALGQPTAVRAVARACASNRMAVAVPCHRVLRQDGTLGGYRWGLERKEALLKNESDT